MKSILRADSQWDFVNVNTDTAEEIIAFRETTAGYLDRVILAAKVQEWGSEHVLLFNANG